MARSMFSLGMFSALAFWIRMRRRVLPEGSEPPAFTAISISLPSLVNVRAMCPQRFILRALRYSNALPIVFLSYVLFDSVPQNYKIIHNRGAPQANICGLSPDASTLRPATPPGSVCSPCRDGGATNTRMKKRTETMRFPSVSVDPSAQLLRGDGGRADDGRVKRHEVLGNARRDARSGGSLCLSREVVLHELLVVVFPLVAIGQLVR